MKSYRFKCNLTSTIKTITTNTTSIGITGLVLISVIKCCFVLTSANESQVSTIFYRNFFEVECTLTKHNGSAIRCSIHCCNQIIISSNSCR